MLIKKKDVSKNLIFFLSVHLIIWTLVPEISNINLPLDTIEHLAWASDLQFGYSKHPPLVAWFLGFFYQIFGSQDWAYYFLSQLFIIFTFLIVYEFSKDFFKNPNHSLISILLLEGIFFYNFTTPEFNVNVCQLPFWALSVLYCWKGFKNNETKNWLLFGLFAGLGVLSKYLFIYLLVAIDIFFIYLFLNKKINYKCFISLAIFLLVLLPHLIWLTENNYTTITYAFNRTGIEESSLINHLIYPLIFLVKQVIILIPFFFMLFFLISKIKIKIKLNFKDRKLLFLIFINILPIILIFLTSFFIGAKIRTMWMTPFYLFFGVLFVYVFKTQINLNKLKNFITVFLVLFFLSPITYLSVSLSQTNKRTDYPGKKIANEVQKSWDKKFDSKISFVSGNEWVGGNLSYHLKSRPKWISLNNKINFKDKLSIVEVYGDEISEAISKIGYFKVYGNK